MVVARFGQLCAVCNADLNMAQITCRDHLSEAGKERCQNVLEWLDASFGALEKVASHAATSHGAVHRYAG